ncbi:MAG: FadR family transcriptional regulator [Desulfobulbaceae bacterium]|nr:FadR family transcriptional regulator [Desulfobulbaceae bacterium]
MRFKPIKPKKISTQIADQIRESILAGDISPGDKLPPERELAEMFGVSRPSVREALNILSASGLVMSYQGGGTVVLSLLDMDRDNALSDLIRLQQERALDVVEVRKGLESWTAFYAAQRANETDIRRMDEIIDSMQHSNHGIAEPEDLDANLHIVIARATHNVVWLHLMQSIFDAMRDFQRGVWRAVYLTEEDRRILLEHHQEVVQAIKAANPEAARDAMLRHLDFAERRSIAYVSLKSDTQQP